MDLSSSVSELSLVGPVFKKRLERLEIRTIEDLLLHVPHKYLDFSLVSEISKAQVGESVTIKGEVVSIKNQYTYSGKKIQIAEIADETGKITAIWFNQPYLVKTFHPTKEVSLAGKVDWFGKKRALISPEYEFESKDQTLIHTGRIIAIYPETFGISSKWLRRKVKESLELVGDRISEFLPQVVLGKHAFPDYRTSIFNIHFPKTLEAVAVARKRLSFNELLFLQLKTVHRKISWAKNKASYKLKVDKNQVRSFINALPFRLTASQEKTVEEIFGDLSKDSPMNRLLEGDVGSGKTVVAAIASFVAFANGYQSVFMAPTQILAQQHFNTLNYLLQSFKVRAGLITSDVKKSDLGRCDIFVGTHALIYNKVDFDEVALVVIDEQHRFGVEQRAHLVKKAGQASTAPHVLTMTATPIPRTVALTLYGDLDLSTLSELPGGRQKITTWIVPKEKRDGAYKWIEENIKKEGIQAFIICPLIEGSEKETMKSLKAAKVEFEKLKEIFRGLKVGLLHGRQSGKEKNGVLEKFKAKETSILVSTPVVEVGIDVPNATIMLIEGAERFGLAQLHQLRGRVGRGSKKSYCLLFSEVRSPKVLSRLSAMIKPYSGFELAELDLKLRGPGEILGTRQHGFPELKIASWSDFELIKAAKATAEDVFRDPQKYKDVVEILGKKKVIKN